MRKYVFKKRWKRAVMAAIDAAGSALFLLYGMFRSKGSAKRVLVLRLDQIGDMIQALPFFRELRARYPGYEVHALCVKECAFLLENNGYADRVHTLSSSWFYKDRKFDKKELARVLGTLKECGFSEAYDLRGDLRNIWLLVRAGAGRIHGYGCAGGGFMLDDEPAYDREEHEIDKNLKLLGLPPAGRVAIDFPVSAAQEQEAQAVIREAGFEGKKFAVIHPFTRAQSKLWGHEKFGALVKRINGSGMKVFIIGARGESVSGAIAFNADTVDCAGRLSLGGTAALIRKCSLFVGNDSGPQYFAAYSGRKTCVIYGYTANPARWAPKVDPADFAGISVPVACGPCESPVCGGREGHACMDLITVDMVWERIKGWL